MVLGSIKKYEGILYSESIETNLSSNFSNSTADRILLENNSFISNDPEEAKILISMALSFFSGIILV